MQFSIELFYLIAVERHSVRKKYKLVEFLSVTALPAEINPEFRNHDEDTVHFIYDVLRNIVCVCSGA